MATTTLDDLEERLSQDISDWIEVEVTTDINAGNLVVSTNLNAYDHGQDDYFNNWWCYITDQANVGKDRQVSDYATSGGQLTVRGAALADDGSNTATVRLYRYSRTDKVRAINQAIRDTYPTLHKSLEDRTLVTGNILPDNSFELWSSTTAMTFYSTSNAALERTTTAGLIRGAMGTTSMKVTPSAANGYAYISSDSFPRLLDLQDHTVTLKVWAYPEVANDAAVVIYTIDSAGSTQTLASTTTCGAGRYTLIELEDQKLNDDLDEIQIRFKVASSGKYTYFDSARLVSDNLYEYLLLSDFADGGIRQVHIQTSGHSDDICDDLHPRAWERLYGYGTYNDGTYEWLRLPNLYTNNRQIKVLGTAPLSTLSATTDTVEIGDPQVNVLIAYAKYALFKMIAGYPSSDDSQKFEEKEIKALYGEYQRLSRQFCMAAPSHTLRLPTKW